MVLLENHNHALPLSTSAPSIAVVGPLADDPLDQLGPDVPIGYDTNPSDFSTVDKIVTVAKGSRTPSRTRPSTTRRAATTRTARRPVASAPRSAPRRPRT